MMFNKTSFTSVSTMSFTSFGVTTQYVIEKYMGDKLCLALLQRWIQEQSTLCRMLVEMRFSLQNRLT